MGEYTRFTKVEADEFKGNVNGSMTGGVIGKTTLSKADDYTLTAAEANAAVIGITMTAASKSAVLGLKDGQVAIVINEGATNAFTAKNLSGDTGTSIAAGKVALVIGSTTANGTAAYILN